MIEFFTLLSGAIAFLSVLKDINGKKIIFWIFVLLLVFCDGLRWEMGTDWIGYNAYFRVADVYRQPGFEPGFLLYTYLIRSITENYSIYLLITTAIIYIGIFYAVFEMTNYSFISVFYLAGMIPWYSGSLRQMMASVFFTLALKASIDRKLTKFLVLMIAGLMFHTTIIVFFPMYWLYGISWITFLLLFIAIAVLSFFSRNLISLLDVLVSYHFGRSYSERIGGTLELSNPLLGFIRKIFTITGYIIFSFAAKTSRSMDVLQWRKIKFTLMLSSFSIILYYVGTYEISHVSSRLDIYPSIISAAVLLGLLDKSFNIKKNRILLFFFVASLVIVFYSRLEYMDLFHPYSSIFYNYEFHRDLY